MSFPFYATFSISIFEMNLISFIDVEMIAF